MAAGSLWRWRRPGSADNDEASKVHNILNTQISAEIDGLENDIYETDKRLNETRLILDRLRAAMLISYYKRAETTTNQTQASQGTQPGIHPAVKKEIGKSLPVTEQRETFKGVDNKPSATNMSRENALQSAQVKHGKTKHRIVVGNVSKYIPVDSRQKNDQVIYINLH